MQKKFAKKFCRKVLNFFGIPILMNSKKIPKKCFFGFCARSLHSCFGISIAPFLFFTWCSLMRQKFAFSFWNIALFFCFFRDVVRCRRAGVSEVGSARYTVHNVRDISPSSNSNQAMDVDADRVIPASRKWKRLYGMHQWPPTMPTGRASPDWRDWLMAPLIMSSIHETWIPGRRSRRHCTWTFDDDHLPERWSEWCAAMSTVLDFYLLRNGLELNHIVKVRYL